MRELIEEIMGKSMIITSAMIGQALMRTSFKVLSLRQPWAWWVLQGDPIKDIENRTWGTRYRGPLLIHASKTMSHQEWNDVHGFVLDAFGHEVADRMPGKVDLGGVIGMVEVTECLSPKFPCNSRWAMEGQYHWMIRNPVRMPLIPMKGGLGLRNLTEEKLSQAIARVAPDPTETGIWAPMIMKWINTYFESPSEYVRMMNETGLTPELALASSPRGARAWGVGGIGLSRVFGTVDR